MTKTISEVRALLGVDGDGRRSGKWLVWESNIGVASARQIDAEIKRSGLTGFARGGRGAAMGTVGVLADQVAQ